MGSRYQTISHSSEPSSHSNDATNNEKLAYYVNNLNTPEFCSALQQHLNLTDNELHASKSMNTNFTKLLHSIAVYKKVYSVLLNAAAILFTALGKWRRSVLMKLETEVKKR
ncbi:hypothetical protein SASPL_139019 [Salvia splendens]|uniref:Uncharacterized protein n=1 Tax=Salvia splendens TaxID=180675 RepID=A0A8X8WXM7_SALSN|nr:hypothetical protein SASPL_139019 [Salvia splendens]